MNEHVDIARRTSLLLVALALAGSGLLTGAHLACDHAEHGPGDHCFLCLHLMSGWASLVDTWTAPTAACQWATEVTVMPDMGSFPASTVSCRAPPGPSV